MARYLLSVHVGTDDRPDQMSPDEARQGYERVAALERDLRDANALVFSARLAGPSETVVVRASIGRAITTDGPLVEAKEVIGGFYIIEVRDRESAVEWAARTSAAIGMPIELREVWDSAG